MPNGWLRADGYLTRVGVFEYVDVSGKVLRELRPPEEVLSAESLKSFETKPTTNDHPPDGLVGDSAEATKRYGRGYVQEGLRADGDRVAGTVVFQDADTVKAIEGGKTQLSCGYTCELDFTPGEWRGLKYDAVQRKIRGDHVALVDRGRMGPEASLRMDAAQQRTDSKEEPSMIKIKIDGVEYDAPEQTAQAVLKALAAGQAKADAASAERDKQAARADGLAADLAKAEAARKDAEDPAKVQARIDARVALEGEARRWLGGDAKLAGKTDREVRALVVAKLDGDTLGAERSDDYVTARFDRAVAVAAKATPALDAARIQLVPRDSAPVNHADAQRVYAERQANAWKEAK